MNAVNSNTPAIDVSWLPQRYSFQVLLEQDDSEHLALIAIDRITNLPVYVESLPANQFDSDGLFRLEHFFTASTRVKSDVYVAPIDWGYAKRGDTDLVYWARPHTEGRNFESALIARSDSTASENSLGLPNTAEAKRLWLEDLLLGLKELHAANLTQQDFRLANVLNRDCRPKLLSPGLRLFSKPKHRNDSWALAFGKTASPELLGLIEHDVNCQSDIYSVGVLFYCLLQNRLPFDGQTLSNVLSEQVTKEIGDECEDAELQNLMRIASHMLEKDPTNRYRSIDSVMHDLDWLAPSEDSSTTEAMFFVGGADVRDTLSAASFIGRQDEIDTIRKCIEDIRTGENRTILVTGDSGNGKTRLIREALREASNLGIGVYLTEAPENSGDRAIAPLTGLIDELKNRPELHAFLREQLTDDYVDIHHFFPKFATSIGLKKPDAASKLEKNVRRDASEESSHEPEFASAEPFEFKKLCRATCNVLSKLPALHRPVVIWIDDCQWLDANTIEALHELSRWNAQSLMVVLSARTTAEIPDASHITLDIDETIEAGPLSDELVKQLVESMAYDLPGQAVETVVNLATGSPFMAEALLRGMVESEALVFQDSQWIVDPNQLNELQASSDATEALLLRLEQFPPQVLEHLSIAAIVGKSFTLAAICALSGASSTDCRINMNWARRQRLVWSRPDGSYAFLHDRIRHAVVMRLPESQRLNLHVRLAEHLIETDGEATQVAIHFDRGGQPERALDIALAAAQRAQEASSLSTALQMLRIAWNGLPKNDLDAQSRVAENIGNVLMFSGQYEEGDQWFSAAEEVAQTDVDLARIQMRHGELTFKKGDKSEAAVILEEAMESLGIKVPKSWLAIHVKLMIEGVIQLLHSVAPRMFIHKVDSKGTLHNQMVWRMYSRLAHCYWYTRSKSATLWAHLAGLNRTEKYQPTRELGQAWSEHAPVMGLIPWYSRGAKYVSKSLKVRRKLNDLWGQGQSRNYFSLLLYATSRYQRCINEAQQAEEILLRTGDYWELNITRYQNAASLYRLGRLADSVVLCKKTYEDAFKVGDYQSTGNIIDVWSRASLGQIPFEYIEQEKKRCLDDLQLQPQLLRAEGVYHLGNNDPSTAIGCFERAVKIAKQAGVCNCYTSGNGAWLATAIRMKSKADHEKGLKNDGLRKIHLKAARNSLWLARRFRNDLPHAFREMGFAWMNEGCERRARKYFAKSLKVANLQNARYESALTQQAFELLDSGFSTRSGVDRRSSGESQVKEIEASVRRSNKRRETVSITNRFDSLLDAGRKIASALGREDILRETVEAAQHLLRGQTTLVVLPSVCNRNTTWKAWNSDKAFDQSIIDEAVSSRTTLLLDRENVGDSTHEQQSSSVLCCPIVVGNEVAACIYIANRLIKAMFGSDETRIVDFIANAAGSSLEKETSFRELDELNASLEQKVLERTKSLQFRTNELEQTAQKLRATQRHLECAVEAAESANQIKSDFLAKMSHEIRTPITAVLGFTQLILRGVIADPNEQRKKIRSIESSGKHLLNLVNDLLDISKIEANKVEVEKIDCRPLHLLSEVVESLRSKATENQNELNLKLVSPIPATIQSDPKRLRQVVTNILGNAIKFTSDGDVTLTVTLAEGKSSGQALLKMDVTDTGIGMSDEQVKNVFDPFVQADSSITRRFGGTGLGLSISKKLAQALGGEIEVTSQSGVGSTFSITIDAGPKSSLELLDDEQLDSFMDRRVTSEAITADLSGMHILLADDAETNRDLISLVLSDCGAKITLAHNGQEAVEKATCGEEFDIVLMDMQMPILDGYSATAKLRSLGIETPIFALTANSMKGDREKCIGAGCNDYLAKPIDINGLVKSMANVIGRGIFSVDTSDISVDVNAVSDSKPLGDDSKCNLAFDESDLPGEGPVRKFSFKFFNTLRDRWIEFEKSIAEKNKEETASLAHWLKGTSGTVMLQDLSAAALEMEESLRANDWDSVELLKELVKLYLDNALVFAGEPVEV